MALACPAATFTLAGTAARPPLLLDNPTAAPPAAAAALSVTVPVEAVPPVTVPGFSVTLEIVGLGAGVPLPGVPPPGLLLPLLVPPLLAPGVVAVVPAKLPAVCGGVPPQAIIMVKEEMTRMRTQRRTRG